MRTTKIALLFLFLTLLIACDQNQPANQELKGITDTEKQQLESFKTEQALKTDFMNYMSDLQKDNWKKLLPKYLKGGGKDFLEEHEAFRNALTDYSVEVMHLVADGNEAIAWINVKAKHIGKFEAFYDGKKSNILEPTGKDMEWQEVWFFDFKDGKFGNKFEYLADELPRMKQLGIKTIPE